MADLGIIFLRIKHTIHWYQSLFTIITESMPFRYFWATLFYYYYYYHYYYCLISPKNLFGSIVLIQCVVIFRLTELID